MKSIVILMLTNIALSCAVVPAAAEPGDDARAGRMEDYVNAKACRKEFGPVWDDIVAMAWEELTFDMAKYEMDVAFIDAEEELKKVRMTNELRQHCRYILSTIG